MPGNLSPLLFLKLGRFPTKAQWEYTWGNLGPLLFLKLGWYGRKTQRCKK